jgi:CRP/FNR family transcriptional regulator, cyclic AMP receptor protein
VLTVIEKVIFLQDVDVFSEVQSEQLAYLAAIAEEITLPTGARIYGEDDDSDAMYLVLEGRVRLHRGETEVATSGPREAFGTWALFDDELRMVAATTVEPTQLLRLDKEDFLEVLADHVLVLQAVFKALVKRVRALGQSMTVAPKS